MCEPAGKLCEPVRCVASHCVKGASRQRQAAIEPHRWQRAPSQVWRQRTAAAAAACRVAGPIASSGLQPRNHLQSLQADQDGAGVLSAHIQWLHRGH